jgi:hypothetical protein
MPSPQCVKTFLKNQEMNLLKSVGLKNSIFLLFFQNLHILTLCKWEHSRVYLTIQAFCQ